MCEHKKKLWGTYVTHNSVQKLWRFLDLELFSRRDLVIGYVDGQLTFWCVYCDAKNKRNQIVEFKSVKFRSHQQT